MYLTKINYFSILILYNFKNNLGATVMICCMEKTYIKRRIRFLWICWKIISRLTRRSMKNSTPKERMLMKISKKKMNTNSWLELFKNLPLSQKALLLLKLSRSILKISMSSHLWTLQTMLQTKGKIKYLKSLSNQDNQMIMILLFLLQNRFNNQQV